LAFGTLAGANAQELANVLAVLDREIAAVQAAIDKHEQPSAMYAQQGSTFDQDYNLATGGKFGWDPGGRYLALAAVNWDHFGGRAVLAYQAGHQYAMQSAASIQGSGRTPDQMASALTTAYAQNAFADHFLTDLFASGHLRTPRKELHDQCGIISGDPVGD